MHTFVHNFFGGVGSVGSPESLQMNIFPNIMHDFFGAVGIVASPESAKMYEFPCIFNNFSVTWEAGEA